MQLTKTKTEKETVWVEVFLQCHKENSRLVKTEKQHTNACALLHNSQNFRTFFAFQAASKLLGKMCTAHVSHL